MLKFLAPTLAGFLGLFSFCFQANAAPLTVVIPEKSSVAFTFQQMGVSMGGKFNRFTSSLYFDPAKPAAAKVSVDVELASFYTGTDLDPEAGAKTWFHTASFPKARFVSQSVKVVSANRFEVFGKLSIKGQTRDITIPASFKPQGESGSFEGKFTLRRSEFSIGEGVWSKTDVVANEVVVEFKLFAATRR